MTLKQARKGVLGVEGAISNNNPPKQVKHDDSSKAVPHRAECCCIRDGLVDAKRGCITAFPTLCSE